MNILLTGGSGMVGQNIIHSNHFKDCNLYSPSREELDLLNKDSINQFLKKNRIDFIIHAAGFVGGIGVNIKYPVEFLYKNLQMGFNLIIEARNSGIKNFLNINPKILLTDIFSADCTHRYKDKYSNLRRIEKIYDKSESLCNLNNDLIEFLENIFDEKMTIFKDKYNSKPPGGEGFYAHYDGIFLWRDQNNSEKKGWYEYSNCFFNVLIALNSSDFSNGTIEIAKIDNLSFDGLLRNTMQNGTPELTKTAEKQRKFNKIDLDVGDIVVFSHKCPHRSSENKSERERGVLYYTYNKLKDGDYYHQYFSDKETSNPGSFVSKALSK